MLTDLHRDALTELVNIGYARAAGALSQLTGYRIGLEVPEVQLHSIDELRWVLSNAAPGNTVAVNQVFSGHVNGTALLLMPEDSANTLVTLLTDRVPEVQNWPENRNEVMSEAGNILLNACLGVFGNLLRVRVNFSLPQVLAADVPSILESITVDSENLSHALLVQTRFHLRYKDLSGWLSIILGVTSLERLMVGLDEWTRQSQEL